MNDAVPILLVLGLVAAALTALWNGYEARQLRETRELNEMIVEELRTVINGNADVTISGFQYMERMQSNITMLIAKSELYDLALSIRKDYPDSSEKFEGTVLKLD
jgi:hypothetical protein